MIKEPSINNNIKPLFTEVYLAGLPQYYPQYSSVLNSLGISVKGVIVDASISSPSFEFISIKKYAHTPEVHNVPVVILDYDEAPGINYFFTFMDRFLRNFAGSTTPLPTFYHAGFIGSFFKDTCNNHWANTGFPGSGNTLVFDIIGYLISTQKMEESELTILLSNLGVQHFSTLYEYIKRLTSEITTTSLDIMESISPGRRMAFGHHNNEHSFKLLNLPNAQMHCKPRAAHDLWIPENRKFLKLLGYKKIFLIIRNPFDIIASNAAKRDRPLTNMLYNDEWFRSFSRQLAQYWKLAIENIDMFHVVRYEDILNDPRTVIKSISEAIDIELSDSEADQVWAKYGFKDLHPNKAGLHFFRPGESKLHYYTPSMVDIMSNDGIREYSNTFGYEWPDTEELSKEHFIDNSEKPENFPRGGQLIPGKYHRYDDPKSGLVIISTSSALMDIIKTKYEKDLAIQLFQHSLADSFGLPITEQEYGTI